MGVERRTDDPSGIGSTIIWRCFLETERWFIATMSWSGPVDFDEVLPMMCLEPGAIQSLFPFGCQTPVHPTRFGFLTLEDMALAGEDPHDDGSMGGVWVGHMPWWWQSGYITGMMALQAKLLVPA